MLAKLEKAKAQNKKLKVSYTTVVFSGSSGVGKTTLMKKLNKEDLSRFPHSTGIAKSKHAICIKTTAIIKSTKELHWTDLDYDSLIDHLNKHLRSLQFSSSFIASPILKDNTSATDIQSSGSKKKWYKKLLPFWSNTHSLPKENTQNVTQLKDTTHEVTRSDSELKEVDLAIAEADSSDTPSLGDVWEIINFLDTGGQPEFVNILPAIRSSVALTFIIFNLSQSLDSPVHVQHNVNGDPSFQPFYLDCTNLEFIKRLIVSSEAFNRNITPSLPSIRRKDGGNDSKICYVGTHALKVNEEEIQKIDDRLSSVASELQLHQRSFWSSSIPQLDRVFPIEMFPNDKERKSFERTVEDIRDNIQKQVEKQDYYEVPITWFLFLLKMQRLCHKKKVSFVKYQEAACIWRDEDIIHDKLGENTNQEVQHERTARNKSDVHHILLFFHFMGMLFYYHLVEGMRDFVFINRQWLFEKLTELVEIKFTKAKYSKKDVSAEDVEKFTREGRLNPIIIKSLKINLQGIEPMNFIHLLDHLNIVAPIDDAQLKDYFMPCVLSSFPPIISSQKCIDIDKVYGDIQHCPLLVCFKNGPMPHGFFLHLIVELFRNLPTGWHQPLLSTSKMQHAYNNLITFHTDSGHAISLFYKVGYLEIQVRCKQNQLSTVHFDVGCKLDTALKKVSYHLQLDKEKLCYGFYCNCEGIQHFAKLDSPTDCARISCKYGFIDLTEHHRVWLREVQLCMINYCSYKYISNCCFIDSDVNNHIQLYFSPR